MTATTAPAKFIFDVDMSHGERNTRVLNTDKLDAMLEAARQEGIALGRDDGEKTETARAAQALLAAAERIAEQAVSIASNSDAMRHALLGEAASLGLSVGRKLAGHMIAREPQAELVALIEECLGSLDHAPHLVVRCHPDLADAMREAAEQRMRTAGFSGRLVVMGEPDIALGDGRIEWVDGGLVRDADAILEQIDKCIAGYLQAGALPADGETDE